MTRKQAIKQLSETGELTTAMLKPLNISFESFLRFSQLPGENAKELMKKLTTHFAKG